MHLGFVYTEQVGLSANLCSKKNLVLQFKIDWLFSLIQVAILDVVPDIKERQMDFQGTPLAHLAILIIVATASHAFYTKPVC